MKTYEIEGTFLVRCGTAGEWANSSEPGKGGNRILKRGEMGWVIGTSDFKIGDGETKWSELEYIKPQPESSPYALRLGQGNDYYTYQQLKDIIDSLTSDPQLPEKVYTLQEKVSTLESSVWNLEQEKTRYYSSKSEFPAIGKQGPIYIDKSTGDAYYFNIDMYDNEGVGWIKLNSFDILQAEL